MAKLLSTIIDGFISSATKFASGFSGSGWKIWSHYAERDENNKELKRYKLEIDDLTVRGSMSVYELLIQKIRAVKGALAITQGSGKVAEVQSDQYNYYLVLEDEEISFVPYDIVRCQRFDTRTNKMKGYWVVITHVNGSVITIPKSEFTQVEGIDILVYPEVGDELVQFGNYMGREGRTNAIYLHADEKSYPAIDVLFNITRKTFDGCLKTRIGGILPGEPDHFNGLYCENGLIKAVDEKTGKLIYEFRPDGSGQIANGAIRWDSNGMKFGPGVTLSWENLDPGAQENLKGKDGEDGIIITLVPEVQVYNASDPPENILVTCFKTVGNNHPVKCDDYWIGWYDEAEERIYLDRVATMVVEEVYARKVNGIITVRAYRNQSDCQQWNDNYIASTSIVRVRNGEKGDKGETVNPPDWVESWTNNGTYIGGTFVASPQMFSGQNTNGNLTGVLMGKNILVGGVSRTGLFGLKNNNVTFSLDATTGDAKITGDMIVDAIKSSQRVLDINNLKIYNNGRLETSNGKIGEFEIENKNLIGYVNDEKRIKFTTDPVPGLNDVVEEETSLKRTGNNRASGPVVTGRYPNNQSGYDYEMDSDDNVLTSGENFDGYVTFYDTFYQGRTNPGTGTFEINVTLNRPGYISIDSSPFIYLTNNSKVELSKDLVVITSKLGTQNNVLNKEILLDAGTHKIEVTMTYKEDGLSVSQENKIQFGMNINRIKFKPLLLCTVVGNDGIVSRFGTNNYLFFKENVGFEVRIGDYGLKITKDGARRIGTWDEKD